MTRLTAGGGHITTTKELTVDRTAGIVVLVEAALATLLSGWGAVWLAAVAGVGSHRVAYGLGVLTSISLIVAELGFVQAFTTPRTAATAVRGAAWLLADRTERRRYLALCAVQLLIFGGIFAAMAHLGASTLLVPVVAVIGIGLHFYLLAGVFKDPRLDGVALGLLATGAAALVFALLYWVPPVVSIGVLGWAVLIIAAIRTLLSPIPAAQPELVGGRR